MPSSKLSTTPFLVLTAYLLFRLIFGYARLPAGTPGWVLQAAFAVSAAASIGLPIAGIGALVRAGTSHRNALLAAAGGLTLWLGLAFGWSSHPRWVAPALSSVQDLGKIVAAAGAGMALAASIREPNLLLPAGLFAAFADFVVVHFGTVKHALSPTNAKGQALVNAVSAQVPALHPSLPTLTIGPADFLFLGIFLACAGRFELGLARNGVLLTVVLAWSLLLVPVIGPIPALAPMSLAFVAANWRRFQLTRDEVVSTAVVLGLVGALFAGYFLFVYRR